MGRIFHHCDALVAALIIEQFDIGAGEAECNTPVSVDPRRPEAGTFPHQWMRSKCRSVSRSYTAVNNLPCECFRVVNRHRSQSQRRAAN